MSPSTIEQEARALLEAENQARYNAALQAVAERRDRERQAAERAAHIEALKTRLAALQDTTTIDKQAAKAEADLRELGALMQAKNNEIAAIRDELQALGNQLPADVQLYPTSGGLVIGDVEVRRQRLQGTFSRIALGVLKEFITRGNISLDRPSD